MSGKTKSLLGIESRYKWNRSEELRRMLSLQEKIRKWRSLPMQSFFWVEGIHNNEAGTWRRERLAVSSSFRWRNSGSFVKVEWTSAIHVQNKIDKQIGVGRSPHLPHHFQSGKPLIKLIFISYILFFLYYPLDIEMDRFEDDFHVNFINLIWNVTI